MTRIIKSKLQYDNPYGLDEKHSAVIVEVSNDNIIPKIRIYDAANDGTYWFNRIGFNRKINDE